MDDIVQACIRRGFMVTVKGIDPQFLGLVSRIQKFPRIDKTLGWVSQKQAQHYMDTSADVEEAADRIVRHIRDGLPSDLSKKETAMLEHQRAESTAQFAAEIAELRKLIVDMQKLNTVEQRDPPPKPEPSALSQVPTNVPPLETVIETATPSEPVKPVEDETRPDFTKEPVVKKKPGRYGKQPHNEAQVNEWIQKSGIRITVDEKTGIHYDESGRQVTDMQGRWLGWFVARARRESVPVAPKV